MISIKDKMKVIGYFDTPIEAAKAYDEVAVATFNENAVTNKSLGLI